MATTTIRVDVETHARLVEMSKDSGTSLMETVRDAADALRRQRFAWKVAGELADLERHASAWTDYLAEAEETSVADGIGR